MATDTALLEEAALPGGPERVILCGHVGDHALPADDAQPLRFSRWQPNRNVTLKIGTIHQAMWRPVPPAFEDLIDIAVYVYCADQAIPRRDRDAGAAWRRRLHFRIPVRQPEQWAEPRVTAALTDVLSFLSEDEYHFEFVPLTRSEPFPNSFTFSDEVDPIDVEEVMLFSGGLDSLAFAVQEAVIDRRRVALINHRSTPKVGRRHARLMDGLRRHAAGTPLLHVPVPINKDRRFCRESTQRSRSFVYLALGATFAQMIGLYRLRFYENGVVSMNLPPAPQIVGARATRTTHPRVIAGFSALLSAIAGRRFDVENRFLWTTKTEVVRLLAEAGCAELIPWSTSCAQTRAATRALPHCGVCSQCIDRRFAVLAAGQEQAEPTTDYGVDLLTGARAELADRTLIGAYFDHWRLFRDGEPDRTNGPGPLLHTFPGGGTSAGLPAGGPRGWRPTHVRTPSSPCPCCDRGCRCGLRPARAAPATARVPADLLAPSCGGAWPGGRARHL